MEVTPNPLSQRGFFHNCSKLTIPAHDLGSSSSRCEKRRHSKTSARCSLSDLWRSAKSAL